MLIRAIVPGSRVNGPGVRVLIYFQGCTLACRSCWNPETHRFAGEEQSIEAVTAIVLSAHQERPFDGVTFSGGEPMQQACDLLALIESIHNRLPALSFGMYSGYSEQELASGRYWCRTECRQGGTPGALAQHPATSRFRSTRTIRCQPA